MPAAEPSPSDASNPPALSPDRRPSAGKKRSILVVTAISVALLLVSAALGILLSTSVGVMHADTDALDKVRTNPAISLHETADSFILSPAEGASGQGLVFIPGAKVSAEAYLYKLSGVVVESGLTVVVTKPFLNVAFFDQRPLTTFTNAAPGVTAWFVGGHSLGGVRACQYAAQPDVSGLVLFASYCANDLTKVDTRALSLSGSADLLSTPEKIAAAANLLPTSTTFFPIEGANHARFGDYGEQAKDGVASLENSVVRDIITTEVGKFIR